MKRYEPQMDSSETFQGMFQDDAGEWVEFDDMLKAKEIVEQQLALVKEDMQKDERCTDKQWYKLIGARDALAHCLLLIESEYSEQFTKTTK